MTANTKHKEQQFSDPGRQAGYSQHDIKKYTDEFVTYASAVNSTPRNVSTTVTANTDPATAALASLPTHATYTTVAVADTTAARATLGQIPTHATHTTTAQVVGVTGVTNTLAHIPKAGNYTVTPKVSRTTAANAIKGAGPNGGGWP